MADIWLATDANGKPFALRKLHDGSGSTLWRADVSCAVATSFEDSRS